MLDETDPGPSDWAGPRVDALSRFLWARALLDRRQMMQYAMYRVECGLSSSAVLGFGGSGFRRSADAGVSAGQFFPAGRIRRGRAIMAIDIVLIAGLRLWMRPILMPLWLLSATSC